VKLRRERICWVQEPQPFRDTLGGLYEEHLRPVHEHRVSVLHEVGTRCAVHLEGAVKGLLDKVVEAGFDAVEVLTPLPGGDLPVESMRGEAGSDTVVLWGGVPDILFALPFTWDAVAAHVRSVLRGDVSFCPKIADLIREEGG
jgi:hypothetical protein